LAPTGRVKEGQLVVLLTFFVGQDGDFFVVGLESIRHENKKNNNRRRVFVGWIFFEKTWNWIDRP